jgi:glycosyltransferase involved in cell wall biosynthesis
MIKVALVHEYLKDYGGAERVLEMLHWIFPDAPVFTAFVDKASLGIHAERFVGWDIRTTNAQNIPGIARHHHRLRWLGPYFWERVDLSEFDLVLSISSGYFSKAVLTRPETLHICYCNTPPRYLWGYTRSNARNWLAACYESWVNTNLRQYDFYASQRIDRIISNSGEIAKRVAKFYGRQSEVIYPPVRVQGYGSAGEDYYLYVGRLTRPKQVELAVSACKRLNRPLWLVGSGSDQARLQSLAGPQVRFLGHIPDDRMAEIYAGAKALIFPCAYEDFGIVPVEAMGHGVPVIALRQGGVCETVVESQTGLFFNEPTVESLCQAMEDFETTSFNAQDCIARAHLFSEQTFVNRLRTYIDNALKLHRVRSEVNPDCGFGELATLSISSPVSH